MRERERKRDANLQFLLEHVDEGDSETLRLVHEQLRVAVLSRCHLQVTVRALHDLRQQLHVLLTRVCEADRPHRRNGLHNDAPSNETVTN